MSEVLATAMGIDRQNGGEEPPRHPIEVLMREHELLLDLGRQLREEAARLRAAMDPTGVAASLARLREIGQDIKGAASHYLREENVVFPYLERHGVVQPPAVMWMEHDRIRSIEKGLQEIFRAEGPAAARGLAVKLEAAAIDLSEMFSSHFQKENSILFPMALELFTDEEWQETWDQFAELGYWRVVPAAVERSGERGGGAGPVGEEGEIAFETGSLPAQVVEAILDTLPVELTFVDADDTVRYYSNGRERIFPRTKAAIGRKVQQCHPEKSIHLVNQILADFKAGRQDHADFWIQAGELFLVIRFFAVRGKGGEYLGCLEVTQDTARIRSLEGEKRLL